MKWAAQFEEESQEEVAAQRKSLLDLRISEKGAQGRRLGLKRPYMPTPTESLLSHSLINAQSLSHTRIPPYLFVEGVSSQETVVLHELEALGGVALVLRRN